MVRYFLARLEKTESKSIVRSLSGLTSFKDPLLGGGTELFQAAGCARFRVDAYHRFGAGKAVTHPGAVVENQLEPVGADNFADPASAEFARILLHFVSELRFHLGGQAEVLAARVKGTNFDK